LLQNFDTFLPDDMTSFTRLYDVTYEETIVFNKPAESFPRS